MPDDITSEDALLITIHEASIAISAQKSGKALCPDLPIDLFKAKIDFWSFLLVIVFNGVFNVYIVPYSWHLGSITALFKKGNRSDPSSYKPITPLETSAMLYGHVQPQRFQTWISDTQKISELRGGFQRHADTIDQCLPCHWF